MVPEHSGKRVQPQKGPYRERGMKRIPDPQSPQTGGAQVGDNPFT
jgi:hypothetical protein